MATQNHGDLSRLLYAPALAVSKHLLNASAHRRRIGEGHAPDVPRPDGAGLVDHE